MYFILFASNARVERREQLPVGSNTLFFCNWPGGILFKFALPAHCFIIYGSRFINSAPMCFPPAYGTVPVV
jgi:hypothetical protein